MSISLDSLLKRIIFYGMAVSLLLSCSSVFFQNNNINILIYNAVFAVLGFFASIDGVEKKVLSNSLTVLILYVPLAFIADYLVADTTQYYYLLFYIFLPVFILICCMWSFDDKIEFLKIMENVIFFMTLSSLVIWFFGPYLQLIQPTGSYQINWGMDRIYYSYYGLSFSEGAQYKSFLGNLFPRNLSIYPEGPFSSLIFSLGLEIYVLTNSARSKFRLMVYAIAIFTTFSTTGWGMLVIILSADYIHKMSKAESESKLNVFFSRVVVPLVMVAAAAYMVYYVLILKETTDNGNFMSHVNALKNGFSLFFNNAVKGVGFGESSEYNSTSGAFRILGDGGLLLALIYLVPVVISFIKAGFGIRNFKVMSLTAFIAVMWVLVIWHYSLLYLFFLALGYSMMIEYVPAEDSEDEENEDEENEDEENGSEGEETGNSENVSVPAAAN